MSWQAEWVWCSTDRLVITGKVSGQRYVFTRSDRVQVINEGDVEQFESLEITQRPCGSCGEAGKRVSTPEPQRIFDVRRT